MKTLIARIPADYRVGREFFIAACLIGALFTGIAGAWLWTWGFVMVFLIAVNAGGRALRDELDEQGLGE